MGWDELAIVSSLVTGIATLGVAVFLSVQLRVQHKDSERLHLDSERQFAFLNENRQQELFISYYETESAANLFWKGASDFDSLTEAEENRYRMMMHSMYFHLVNAWKLERGPDFGYISVAVTMITQQQVAPTVGVGGLQLCPDS